MTGLPAGAPDHRVEIAMPEAQVPGVFADLVGVWHTPDVFVLDFSTLVEPARRHPDPAVAPTIVQRAQVVARVRVPPSQIFEIMKALEQQLTAWEAETGRSAGAS